MLDHRFEKGRERGKLTANSALYDDNLEKSLGCIYASGHSGSSEDSIKHTTLATKLETVTKVRVVNEETTS